MVEPVIDDETARPAAAVPSSAAGDAAGAGAVRARAQLRAQLEQSRANCEAAEAELGAMREQLSVFEEEGRGGREW